MAIVTFGDDARVLLDPTPAKHRRDILEVIDRLHPGSSTLEAGLRPGYELARSA